MADQSGFNVSDPPPTLQEFQNDFQPTATDINAVHGQRTGTEAKADDSTIRIMEVDGMPRSWSDPYFECQDLSSFDVLNPEVDYPRIARKYENILDVWQKNFGFGKKIQQNPKLKLPAFARLDQAVNGDLEASNKRRRQHLIGTIAYCWQLRALMAKEKEWKRARSERKKVIRPKAAKKQKSKSKKDSKEKPGRKGKG